MTEYITKEQAREVVKIVARHGGVDSIINADKRLAAMPAADVAPVVHARWRYVGSNWECSCCLFPVPRKSSFYHWCPQCGARMDGEEND